MRSAHTTARVHGLVAAPGEGLSFVKERPTARSSFRGRREGVLESKANSTEILKKSRLGDGAATQELVGLLYDRLRRLAASYVRRCSWQQTLQATDLVHQAYLELVDQDPVDWKDKTHFFAVAAAAMRNVLASYARRKFALKRGGDWRRVPLGDSMSLSGQREVEVASLLDALAELEALHERQARVVELRFFGGLKEEEVAEILGVSLRTVTADWHAARSWLFRRLRRE